MENQKYIYKYKQRTYNVFVNSRNTLRRKSLSEKSRVDYTSLLSKDATIKDNKWKLEDKISSLSKEIKSLHGIWHNELKQIINEMNIYFNKYLEEKADDKFGRIKLEPEVFDSNIKPEY